MLKVKQIFVEGTDKNFSYVLYDEESLEGAIIDPNGKIDRVFGFIEEQNLQIKYLINTHSHHDHVEHNDLVKEKYRIKNAMHKDEPGRKDLSVDDSEEWKLGERPFQFLHTPGHSPGGLCILADGQLISGDTLFVGRSGRTIFAGGSPGAMFQSMQSLSTLGDEVQIFPGHDYGDQPTSTIGRERKHNKCLRAKTVEEFKSLGI